MKRLSNTLLLTALLSLLFSLSSGAETRAPLLVVDTLQVCDFAGESEESEESSSVGKPEPCLWQGAQLARHSSSGFSLDPHYHFNIRAPPVK